MKNKLYLLLIILFIPLVNGEIGYGSGNFNLGSFGVSEVIEDTIVEQSSSGGGGGSSGGGGSVVRNTFKAGERTQRLVYGNVMYVEFEGSRHTTMISKVYSDRIVIKVRSTLHTLDLSIGETGMIDFNEDGIDDMSIKLVSIERIGGTFLFNMLSQTVEEVVDIIEPVIVEEVVEDKIEQIVSAIPDSIDEEETVVVPEEEGKTARNGWVFVLIPLVALSIGLIVYWKTRKNKEE